MMKAILFGLVLAVTIPACFFSPAPLDKLTMNLNIPDSPRGRQHGYPGYDAPWGDDYQAPGLRPCKMNKVLEAPCKCGLIGPSICQKGTICVYTKACLKKCTDVQKLPEEEQIIQEQCPNPTEEENDVVPKITGNPTMTTTAPGPAREQEVLEKIMQGVQELKEREKSGNLSRQAMVGGDQCDFLQIFKCAATLPEKVAKCEIEFEEPIAILNCVKEIASSECKPCICYFIEMIGLPCPDLEFVKKKMMKGVEELKEREKSGNLSRQARAGGDQCDLAQILVCDITLPGKVAICFADILKGPEAFVNCISEKAISECKPCICYFIELIGQPCPLGEEEEGEEHDEEGYVGCYDNELEPKLYGNQTISLIQHNSRDRCSKECQQKYPKTTFIGLETGYMCHCGLTEPKFSHRNQPVADYKCNVNRCPGDRYGKCGGHNYIKIFQI